MAQRGPNAAGARGQVTLAELAALPAWLTTDQAAKVMGSSRETIVEGCRRQLWTCARLPGAAGRWRIYTPSFLEAFGMDGDVAAVRELLGISGDATYTVGRVTVAAGSATGRVDMKPKPASRRDMLKDALSRYPDVMDVSQVAEATGKNVETVRRWARSGKMPCSKAGLTWLFSKSSVIEMMLGPGETPRPKECSAGSPGKPAPARDPVG